jgi:hypothetical protein
MSEKISKEQDKENRKLILKHLILREMSKKGTTPAKNIDTKEDIDIVASGTADGVLKSPFAKDIEEK